VREVIGLDVGEAETEAFWTEFLFSLKARGLQGVRVCVSDAHLGLRNAIARVLGCRWQRCTVHFLRDMLGHCARSQQPMIAAAIRQSFRSDSAAEARERLAELTERLSEPAPKVCELLEDASEELLCFYAFPREHWPKLRSTDENVKGRVSMQVSASGATLGSGVVDPRAKCRVWGFSPAAQRVPIGDLRVAPHWRRPRPLCGPAPWPASRRPAGDTHAPLAR
jgi:putative transposase